MGSRCTPISDSFQLPERTVAGKDRSGDGRCKVSRIVCREALFGFRMHYLRADYPYLQWNKKNTIKKQKKNKCSNIVAGGDPCCFCTM